MSDPDWMGAALAAARPQAMAALLRYFRNLDTAEEAFQEACLRAIRAWPLKGPPRDVVSWLVFVGRNAGIDGIRRSGRRGDMPPDSALSDTGDAEAEMADRLDDSQYRDDVLRLLFICCHPDLPATQQIALALRIVSGLSVAEIAHAFLVSEAAMEQRITRAKRKIASSGVPYGSPGPAERSERLGTVAAALYLVFNEGYAASGGDSLIRRPLCEEAIRLARLLLRMFPTEPEIMGLVALMLLQHARAAARLNDCGEIVLLEDQDRSKWDRHLIIEGLALVDKALRHREFGVYQLQAAIAGAHARAATAEATDWGRIAGLYAILEDIQPSPVVTLNRAVAVSRVEGAAAALRLIEPLATRLAGYFHFHGLKGQLLLRCGEEDGARAAFDRAIALARTPAEAGHIRMQLDRLKDESALLAG